MTEQFIQGIVRILNDNRTVAGTGFVISKSGLIATCSHVIQDVKSQSDGKRCPEKVRVIFHATGEELDARVEPMWWRPWDAEDLSILQSEGILPPGVEPLPLGSSKGTGGHDICTFGFPEMGYDIDVDGIGGDGKVVSLLSGAKRSLLQLRSNEITVGFSGAPVWDKLTRRVIGVVSDVAEPDSHHRLVETAFAISTETLQHVCRPLHISDICPYLGLAAFTETDAEFFFGRQFIINRILNKLSKYPSFLTILGPSGSGKSSVVQAGFIPQLRKGGVPGSDRWGVLIKRPANDPFVELAGQGLAGETPHLRENAEIWLRQHPEQKRLVLIFDQFEEIFVPGSEALCQSLIEQITQLVQSSLPISVILVMRNDFYSRLAQHEALMAEVEKSQVNIPQLTREDLTTMIQKPAEAVGLRFEEGLVEAIVKDATEASLEAEDGGPAGQSTVLPLLESALTELWKRREDGMLTHDAYAVIGAVVGALNQWAEQAFRELQSEEQRQLAHRIFTDLVYLGDESQGILDIRRRRELTSLYRQDHEQQDVQHVVEHLADNRHRILVKGRDIQTGEATVEIIHDVLLHTWGSLKEWIEKDRDFLEWHQALERQAQAWAKKRDKDKLLRGSDLAKAIGYLDKRHGEMNQSEHGFIVASKDRRRLVGRRIALLIVALVLILIGGPTGTIIFIHPGTTINAINPIHLDRLDKQTLLKDVEALEPGVNIGVYKKTFGDPQYIRQNGDPTYINQPGEMKIKEYIFVSKYFYLDVITDTNDTVQYFAVTIRDKDFNPTFTIPTVSQTTATSYAQITLGISTFKDISGADNLPMSISGCVGAHDVYYHEIYYFGLPGKYQQFGFGLNEAGYLANKYEDYIPSLVKINLCLSPTGERPAFTGQDLENLQPMRTKTIFNTYAVSAPTVSIEDYNFKMDLGVVGF